jgi:hypothetical protein
LFAKGLVFAFITFTLSLQSYWTTRGPYGFIFLWTWFDAGWVAEFDWWRSKSFGIDDEPYNWLFKECFLLTPWFYVFVPFFEGILISLISSKFMSNIEGLDFYLIWSNVIWEEVKFDCW